MNFELISKVLGVNSYAVWGFTVPTILKQGLGLGLGLGLDIII